MDLTQYTWKHREIPTEMCWMILILIPQGKTNNSRISLLDTLYKVVESIIDTCLKVCINFHDVLHRFRVGRGTDIAILELKLVQELAIIDQ